MVKYGLMILGLALLASCADATQEQGITVKKTSAASSNASAGTNLLLTWDPQDVTAFHIFYRDPSNKVREIDSLQKIDADFAKPRIVVDKINMEAWPAAGSKACFYVIAENSGLKSDASADACIQL